MLAPVHRVTKCCSFQVSHPSPHIIYRPARHCTPREARRGHAGSSVRKSVRMRAAKAAPAPGGRSNLALRKSAAFVFLCVLSLFRTENTFPTFSYSILFSYNLAPLTRTPHNAPVRHATHDARLCHRPARPRDLRVLLYGHLAVQQQRLDHQRSQRRHLDQGRYRPRQLHHRVEQPASDPSVHTNSRRLCRRNRWVCHCEPPERRLGCRLELPREPRPGF